MLHANVLHKSMYVYFSTFVSLLRQGAIQNSHGAALPGSIVAHASSGQFLGSLISDHSAQLLCVAVVICFFQFDCLAQST